MRCTSVVVVLVVAAAAVVVVVVLVVVFSCSSCSLVDRKCITVTDSSSVECFNAVFEMRCTFARCRRLTVHQQTTLACQTPSFFVSQSPVLTFFHVAQHAS